MDWKGRLSGQLPPEIANEIEVYETQLELRRREQLGEKIFAETRLRRGVYGQRYDNGKRHDGVASRDLVFPSGELTKGPNTFWDAPGMMRIKIPFGALDSDQLEVLADLAEEYSDAICHITTRQDVQLHFIHIDDTPDIMRRLAAVGITTQEACGNSVRNVTACPLAGVCHDEPFDVTPYSRALAYHLLGHKDAQDFGRKFKIAFSGCAQHACGLVSMHDLGCVARVREVDGDQRRGFSVYVGGGLGAVPHQAKLLREFVAEEELLPVAQAVCRVFARLGEKRNRARARVKFLVQKLGIEEFRRLVDQELEIIPHDERWTAYLEDLGQTDEAPTRMPQPGGLSSLGNPTEEQLEDYRAWRRTNVQAQRQEGYYVATVSLPLGDLTTRQTRGLADVARRYNGGRLRTTVEQNIVLRWIIEADLPDLYRDLVSIALDQPGAGTLIDITACPGTDTCKLGISSSRGLAAELRQRIASESFAAEEAIEGLRIKISGCFNSCAQHHIADLGFYGVSRKKDGRTVPHFQVVLGGQWQENGGSYGLAIVAIPARRVPDAVQRILRLYSDERDRGESFQDFVQRVGKARVRQLLDDLLEIADYDQDRSLYSDWGDPREYTIGDMGKGECAGEVVPRVEFGLAASERQVFEAQLRLDEGNPEDAVQRAYEAMLQAAKALITVQNIDIGDEPRVIVDEFRTRYYDTKLFFDPFAGGKFANYLFHAQDRVRQNGGATQGNLGTSSAVTLAASVEAAHRQIEEAQLFIEAAHACYGRLSESPQ